MLQEITSQLLHFGAQGVYLTWALSHRKQAQHRGMQGVEEKDELDNGNCQGWAGVGFFSCLLHICSIEARSLRWVAGGRATAAAKTSYSVSLSGYSPPWTNPSFVQLFRFSAAAI